MVTDEECVDYARECVRLVGLTVDQEIRDQLLNRLANGWPLRCTSATAPCVRAGHEGLGLALAENHRLTLERSQCHASRLSLGTSSEFLEEIFGLGIVGPDCQRALEPFDRSLVLTSERVGFAQAGINVGGVGIEGRGRILRGVWLVRGRRRIDDRRGRLERLAIPLVGREATSRRLAFVLRFSMIRGV